MPAARQRSRSSLRERAVKAMIGEVSPRGPLPLPQRLNDLKAVQLRHVHVQEQQVDALLFRQGQRLAPVGRQPEPCDPAG